MIEVRKQNKNENVLNGDNFPVTLIIGDTTKYLTEKAFIELRNKLNKFDIPNVVGRFYSNKEIEELKEECYQDGIDEGQFI